MTPRPPSDDSTQHTGPTAEGPTPVKKTATKKTAAKKTVAKKATAKKAATKKAATKATSTAAGTTAKAVGGTAKGRKTAEKTPPAEQTADGTSAVRKAAGAKAVVKKAVEGTPAVKESAEGKAVAKKSAPRKSAEAQGAFGKAPAKKAPARKSTAKKAVAKKATAKKAVAKTAVAKAAVEDTAVTETAVAETGVTKPAAVRKTVAKKAAVKKAVTKKAAGKKTVAEEAVTTEAVARKAAAAKRAVTSPRRAESAVLVPAVPPGSGTSTPVPTPADAPPPEPVLPKQAAAEPTAPDPVVPRQAVAEPVPAGSVAPQPSVAEPALAQPVFSPAMDGADRERLLDGTHHAPHSVLGAHAAPGGVVFRAFRPYALGVGVVVESLRAELHDDGGGFFSALLPLREVPETYRLLVSYEGTEQETEDAYRFLPAIGELDLYLIGEGRHEELWRALGAEPMTHQGVTGTRFTVWAPNARGVRLAGTFNFWDATGYPMRSLGSSGVWELFVPGIGEGELYKFEITRPDGSKTLRADPLARRTEVPPHTSSVIHASHYEWTDEEWLAHRTQTPAHEAPFSVYEVHLPSWRPGLTYRQLAEQLPAYVCDLGFTHVELLPIAEHPFGGSWGYQVTGFYAPTARLGTPDDFKFLVDALHRAGIGVLMDWVPAHFPRDDWALAEFDGRPLYEHEDPQRAAHPDWGTLEFDYGRREVRNFLVANALYWCEEYHIDGLRVDAVASMLYLDYSREPGQWTPNEHGGRENLDAVAFLQEMNATVYRRVPGVVTIAEESTAWDGVTRATHHTGPGGFGGLGFGMKWNMGWMHDSLDYMAKDPIHRKHHHHEMTFSMVYAYSENYVLPISHDEVVHGKGSLVSKMPGDWWQQRANHRAYLGFMWAHPGKQLLFMGQEFAQGAEWSEAHGPDWWLMDPAYGAEADHRGVRDLVRDLNTAYRHTPALWQQDTRPAGFSWITGDSADDNVLAFLRFAEDGSPLLAVSNFSPVVREDYRLGVPEDVPAWREILNTDAAAYGGTDTTTPDPVKPDPQPWHAQSASIRVTLPPLTTLWLRPA
ncbi:1,4-alpha-glucan branching enzyme [Streptomyces europaeiscabiei]|uniref:1,4-alpha-glucan branching enzyme n=1 Tax=Streptomyces europaeiscabiei TaxID=146819 RepID=UPI0029A8B3CB|nr:1,4-alpha-glucan branching enzyme [Streptomyces europaeiscabiei]MDX2530598.1 1,4-alpha-glucan branching enzyme [Streptomyces europaeiscabiei]MDX3848018.1 1,4-alpha-glucan branching enzyme [Streptomyces europaeiscabiei]